MTDHVENYQAMYKNFLTCWKQNQLNIEYSIFNLFCFCFHASNNFVVVPSTLYFYSADVFLTVYDLNGENFSELIKNYNLP